MKPEDTTWAETQRAIHKPQNRTAMNSETPQVDELVHRITNNPGVTWSNSEICEMIELAMRLELRCKRLEEVLKFYADSENYFAITILPDPPCGEFSNDFSECERSDGLKWTKPGKRARAALADYQEERP